MKEYRFSLEKFHPQCMLLCFLLDLISKFLPVFLTDFLSSYHNFPQTSQSFFQQFSKGLHNHQVATPMRIPPRAHNEISFGAPAGMPGFLATPSLRGVPKVCGERVLERFPGKLKKTFN